MPQPIAIVAGSAEAAAPCYQHDFLEGADLLGRHNHPEISMHCRPFAEYVKCICANERAGAAELMLSSPQKRGKT